MAIVAKKKVTPFAGIQIKTNNAQQDAVLAFKRINTAVVTGDITAGDAFLYINSSDQLIFHTSSGPTTLGSAGSLVNFSLDDAYDD